MMASINRIVKSVELLRYQKVRFAVLVGLFLERMRCSSTGIDNQARPGKKQIANHSGACSRVGEKRNQSSGDACLRSNANSAIVPSGIIGQVFAIGARITNEQQHDENRTENKTPDVSEDKPFVEKEFGASGHAQHTEPDDGVGEPKSQKQDHHAGN
jgi:hypothetical protein